MSSRAIKLADRIILGAEILATFANDLTDEQWCAVVHPDGRTVGVLVHHVASMYPLELDVINVAVAGHAITDVSWEGLARINAEHAQRFAAVTKPEALQLLVRNSREAAAAIRMLSDVALDRAVPFSLSGGAPMTVQFIIEDHPLKHPWHHLTRIQRALGVSEHELAMAT